MSGIRVSRLLPAVGLLLMGILLCCLPIAVSVAQKKPIDASTTASVLSLAIGTAGLLLSALSFFFARRSERTSELRNNSKQAAAALDRLALEMSSRWQKEAAERRLTSGVPIELSWSTTGPPPSGVITGVGPDKIPHPEAFESVPATGDVVNLHNEVYARAEHGRLAIVGEPGAGKTAAMLMLLLAALAHRKSLNESDRNQVPVPVWVGLSGWDPFSENLRSWVVTATESGHDFLRSGLYGAEPARSLYDSNRLALFLDGLDEMAPTARPKAIRAIEEAGIETRIVLTSRVDEFESATARIEWKNVIRVDLAEVDTSSALRYLSRDGGESSAAWGSVVEYATNSPGSAIAQILHNPLNLSLLRETYRRRDPRELLVYNENALLLQAHLLLGTLTAPFVDPKERYETVFELSILADNMRGSRDIAWWKLPFIGRARWYWLFYTRILVGPASIASFGIAVSEGFPEGFAWLAAGPLFSIAMGAWLVGFADMATYAPRRFRFRRPSRRVLKVAILSIPYFVVGFASGGILDLTTGASFSWNNVYAEAISWTPIGITLAAWIALGAWIYEWSIPEPGHGATLELSEAVRQDFKARLWLSIYVGASVAILLGVTSISDYSSTYENIIEALGSIAAGLTIAIVILLAATPSVNLYVIKRCARSTIGLDYLELLQKCIRLHLFRSSGPVYQFRHALLQDYLCVIRSQFMENRGPLVNLVIEAADEHDLAGSIET